MLTNPCGHARFKRGLNVLLEGLQEHFGQERLHAFVRALEALARFAYERILSAPDLRRHFKSDTTITEFWSLPSNQRQPLWGTQFDVDAVA